MKKQLYIFIILASFLLPSTARADFEIIQKIIKVIKEVQDKGIVVLQKYNAVQEEISSTYEGLQGDRAAFQAEINKAKGLASVKTLKNSVNTVFTDVRDFEKNQEDIKENYFVQLGQGSETEASQEQELKMQLVIADKLSSLYAQGFTTRVNLAKEVKNNPVRKTNQDIVVATKDLQDTSAKRIANISQFNSGRFQYFLTESSKEYSGGSEDDK